MPKKKNMSYGSKTSPNESYDSGYYEPFAGYHNSNVDQARYWNMVKTAKGVIPKEFMEIELPMADDVGKKGQPTQKVGFKK